MAFQKGHAKAGGRKKGEPNKATSEVKLLASKHGPAAIEAAAKMAGLIKEKGQVVGMAESESARIAALNTILDRAYGKATQPIAGDDDMPAIRAALRVSFIGASGG